MKYITNVAVDIDETSIVIEELEKLRDILRDRYNNPELSAKFQEVLTTYSNFKGVNKA